MLKEMRKRRNMTQKELSDKSKVSTRLIQAYEQGTKSINGAHLLTLSHLAMALECDIIDILEIDTNTYNAFSMYESHQKTH